MGTAKSFQLSINSFIASSFNIFLLQGHALGEDLLMLSFVRFLSSIRLNSHLIREDSRHLFPSS